MPLFLIVGCAHNPNILVYFLYAANDLAITPQNLVKKTRFNSIIAYFTGIFCVLSGGQSIIAAQHQPRNTSRATPHHKGEE
jgi:hypothetical protein